MTNAETFFVCLPFCRLKEFAVVFAGALRAAAVFPLVRVELCYTRVYRARVAFAFFETASTCEPRLCMTI
jgi:hypothetical protein